MIIHTSDLHIKEAGDERWKALKEILKISEERKAKVFVISGDLFDKDVSARKLKVKLRKLFSDTPFQIIILPGNHDSSSFKPGLNFGSRVTLLTDFKNPVVLENEKLRIWGLPFEDIDEVDIIDRLKILKEKIPDDNFCNVLLYHGQLIAGGYRYNDFGKEGRKKYMPVKLSDFEGLKINYVLGGHYHTNFRKHEYSEGEYFIYPGSPVPVTRKETGKRYVDFIKPGDQPKKIEVPGHYYKNVEITLDPEGESQVKQKIKTTLEKISGNVKLILEVNGYITGEKITEVELEDFTRKQAKNQVDLVELKFRVDDIGEVLTDDLYRKFIKKLDEKNLPSQKKKKVKELVIKSMREVL
ncbi:MAG: metallophosphoesterase family protein [Elusimicrobiota bacterium]